jgi:hypothetical protein
MLRSLLCAVLALFLVAGVTFGGDKAKSKKPKKGTSVSGKFSGFKDGKLTLSVKGKAKTKAKAKASKKTFVVADDTKVTVYSKSGGKAMTGADGFAGVKKGTKVSVSLDADGKTVTSVAVGTKPKAKKSTKTKPKKSTKTKSKKPKKDEAKTIKKDAPKDVKKDAAKDAKKDEAKDAKKKDEAKKDEAKDAKKDEAKKDGSKKDE